MQCGIQRKKGTEHMEKKGNTAGQILTWIIILIAFSVVLFTVFTLRSADVNGRSVFGVRAFVVLSDSMSATDFSSGDLIVSRSVDPYELAEGDIISFISQNSENYGEVVTHKIRRHTTDAYGGPAFVTYGTTTDTDDEAPVPYSAILGKYSFKVPGVGKFVNFLKTPMGYVVVILIPFMLLIGYQAVRSILLYREYKAARRRAIEAYKRKIMRERQEAARMRAELARRNGQTVPPERPAPKPKN